ELHQRPELRVRYAAHEIVRGVVEREELLVEGEPGQREKAARGGDRQEDHRPPERLHPPRLWHRVPGSDDKLLAVLCRLDVETVKAPQHVLAHVGQYESSTLEARPVLQERRQIEVVL